MKGKQAEDLALLGAPLVEKPSHCARFTQKQLAIQHRPPCNPIVL